MPEPVDPEFTAITTLDPAAPIEFTTIEYTATRPRPMTLGDSPVFIDCSVGHDWLAFDRLTTHFWMLTR